MCADRKKEKKTFYHREESKIIRADFEIKRIFSIYKIIHSSLVLLQSFTFHDDLLLVKISILLIAFCKVKFKIEKENNL